MKREGLAFFGAVVGAVAFFIGIGLAVSFVPVWLSPPEPTPTSGPIAIDNPRLMADFTLLDQNGQPRKLSDSRGKAVLIFYGYTHCPDVCPLSMADFKRIKADLSANDAALASQVDYVMISVDGERDTPEVMKRYVESFDPQFIGLTGQSSAVAAIGKDYGVRFEKQKPVGTQAAYLVAHTSFTYLLDAQGYWRYAFPFGTPPGQIAQELLRILRPR